MQDHKKQTLKAWSSFKKKLTYKAFIYRYLQQTLSILVAFNSQTLITTHLEPLESPPLLTINSK